MTTLRELMAKGLLAEPQNKLKPSLLGALQDPYFYKDMANNLAGLLGTPTPTKAENDAVLSQLRLGRSVMQSYPSRERELMQSHDNKLMGLAQMAAPITYHGSPHKFDAFDSSKIGTGEGAQAYGHGLYLADNPGVAKQYQAQLAGDGFLVGDKVFDPSKLKHVNVKVLTQRGDLDGAISKARAIAASDSPVASMAADDLTVLLDAKAKGGLVKNPGSLYTVDLPDEAVSKMLDWDKPLSQQPEMAGKLRRLAELPEFRKGMLGEALQPFELKNTTGQTVVGLLDTYFKGDRARVSRILNRLGIPGIRYLDGGSRGQRAGTSNYVVFDDKLPKILKRE